ncbi:hypothetical protein CEQ90_13830 [Lewinellaceae bacterium SD302]|nr:hypothetical protein CEQ90_13830 [Lewinellaceae bacterium SD302]
MKNKTRTDIIIDVLLNERRGAPNNFLIAAGLCLHTWPIYAIHGFRKLGHNLSALPVLTLTTDFGSRDFHLARLKGHLLAAVPDLTFVDVSHDIPNYDIVEAAFLFRKVWPHFPPGSIHLISVNDFYQPKGRLLACTVNGHYFIGPDNGLFSLVFDQAPAQFYAIDHQDQPSSLSKAYATAIAHISSKKTLEGLGSTTNKIAERLAFQPVIGPDYIRGSVIYIDGFSNAITNISRELFERVGQGRAFELLIKRNAAIDGLSFRYHDVPEGESLIKFDSDGLLEIAINLGKAATLLGIEVEDTVQVEFG